MLPRLVSNSWAQVIHLLCIRVAPDAIVAKQLCMVHQHITGGRAAHGQTCISTALCSGADMIVALHIGHDVIDLICLDVRVLPIGSGVACPLTILLIVHCDNDKRLCLSLRDQVVQNIGRRR